MVLPLGRYARSFAAYHLIIAFGVWGGVVTSLVSAVLIMSGKPAPRALMLMVVGLTVLWVVVGGTFMRLGRDRVRALVQRAPWDWRLTFIVFCTLLALVEEAITTMMTNLAPVFGVPVGVAYITASANYIDVVCCHSVIVFVPMFIAWAFLLSCRRFSPDAVFILFGLTGVLAEAGSFGLANLANAGFWVFVYGLMVYLPAYCIPANRPARPPRWWHYPLAVGLPLVAAMPVAGVVAYLHPTKIHFAPIAG